ncbi:MAG: hypothetical protein HY606_13415 [Planctomycetes bacterium]|nr:hypothetical protein [Planctomycetota bacterium]
MSDEVLMELVKKAVNDKKFAKEAVKDLDGTLSKYGFLDKLVQEELDAIKEFHNKVKDLPSDQLNKELTGALSGKKGGG